VPRLFENGNVILEKEYKTLEGYSQKINEIEVLAQVT
jgi:hypothetical protein